ncbi:MAG: amino acid ABC transporter substrate-binding protein, partial [Aquabacterium sp.]
MINLLKHGRVSLIATEDITLAQELAAGGLPLDQVQAHYSLMSSDYYIAFSPQTDPERVRRWQAMLETMRADGSLQRIVHRWLPGLTLP